ncbi:glycosyltransferase family 4 protein [Gordonia soli]|uniref:Putative glycosyltransferase n=1 Tax=Gordonia soli NBRC 108243 TaxID=1223545 RepID=M0QKV3_9ACTN|nr:glycosyltransferase family 4 protein [Gordonia soli]GAC69193.1 putative glycosyltransferase [Gordonia soli NBRC 108243]
MPRAYVALTQGLRVSDWSRRHAADEVPDTTPYGLHHLNDHGIDVQFSTPAERSPLRTRVAGSIYHRTDGLEFVHVGEHRSRLRPDATDAVFSYDERTGFPAAITPGTAPVVSGVAWLERRSDAPRLHGLAAAWALPRAAALFTQCAPMATIISNEWRVPTGRMHYVPLGIDTDFYAEQPWPTDASPTVVSAGEDRFRDHALLIDAVRRVRDRHRDLRLELATGLPVDLPAEWGRLYTERLDGRMRDLYRKASVVAVALTPTATGSGLTVVLEAMASGRPIVVTANPGIDEYVTDGETGILVRPGDPESFADAIGSLVDDPDRAREIGARAAAEARRRFTSAAMAGRFAELIRSVI